MTIWSLMDPVLMVPQLEFASRAKCEHPVSCDKNENGYFGSIRTY